MECSEGPKTAAPFPKKEGRRFFAHVCLQEHSRTFPFVIQVYTIICQFLFMVIASMFMWLRRSTCLEILSFAAMDRSLSPHAAGDRESVRQFCPMIVGTSNTNARSVDRTDWLIQQFQPEPLHPWQRTEPKSFLFQIYNLAAWEPLQEKMWKLMEQKMDYDRDHFNSHGNPETTPLNGAGRTCVKLFGGEAKRQPLLASSESTAGVTVALLIGW